MGWRGAAGGVVPNLGIPPAAAALAVLYYLLAYFGDLGLGDVRLAGVAGLLHGWGTVVRRTIAAIAIGGLAAAVLLAAGRRRTSDLAFGPAIALGAVIAVSFG